LIYEKHTKEIANAIMNSKIVTIKGAGHSSFKQKHSQSNKIVIDFLKEQHKNKDFFES
jgi:uncharacterized phosphosugar-binding protein